MGSRRATDCIAGDKPVDADSPAPGRRVRVLLTAGAGAARGRAAGKNRGRARLGAGKNTVRELLGAAARLAHRRCRSRAWARSRKQPRACETRRRKRHGARLAHRRCRSRAQARSRKQPRACETRRRKRHGARLAHRRCRSRAQARGCAGLFPLIFRLFLFGFLPLKSLFICRSGRDGNSLACPLPWLCFRPVGLVTCCFFADFCAHCPFACSALFMRALSLVFCLFLPNFFLSNLFSFVAQAATGLYFLPKRK